MPLPTDPAQLEAASEAGKAALEEEKKQHSGSAMADIAEGVVDVAASGAVEMLGSVASAVVSGLGTVASGAADAAGSVASGAVEVAGAIIGGIFDA